MKKSPLISVIIPVYNVKQYLTKCLDSVISQSYENLEIIIVDDGSFDGSEEICDLYGKKDIRIKVIHQNNAGLSAARNTGLDISTGEYITFIDSDDWIDKEAIEYMLTMVIKNDADAGGVRFCSVYNDLEPENVYDNVETIYDNIQSLEIYLFNGYISPCACGKIWKASCWRNKRFPVGKLFEDQYTIYQLIENINIFVLSSNKMYFYRKRKGSIGHSPFSAKTYELYDAINIQHNYIISKYPELSPSINTALVTWEIVFVNMMLRSNAEKDKEIITSIRNDAKKYILDCLNCCYIPWNRKGQILLFAYCFNIYKFLYKKYIKKRMYY